MFQKTAAFLVRSLRQDNRLFSVGLMRFAMVGITLFFIYIARTELPDQLYSGLVLLGFLTVINLCIIGILGVSYFPSVITEEKEERTIGLLLMTGISPLSMLLGKSLSKQLNAIVLLSIQFPFAFLAITLGGITIDQVVSVYVFLLVTLLGAANIGLLASVIMRTSFAASILSGAVILVILFGYYIIFVLKNLFMVAFMQQSFLFQKCEEYLVTINPVTKIEVIFQTGGLVTPFDSYFYAYLLISVFCFVLSLILFPYFVKSDMPENVVPVKHRIANLFRKKKKLFMERQSQRVKGNAFVWKDFNFYAGGKRLWFKKSFYYPFGLFVIFLLFFLVTIQYPNFTMSEFMSEFGDIVFGCVIYAIILEAIYYVSQIFSQEIKLNSLGLLYMIPGSQRKKIYLKVAGNLLGLVPVLFVFFGSFVFFWLYYKMFSKYHAYTISFNNFYQKIWDSLYDPEFWFGVSVIILVIHLLLTATLFIKRGAIPLVAISTLFITFTINSSTGLLYKFVVTGSFMSYRVNENLMNDWANIISVIILLTASILMHFVIIPLRMKKIVASG